MSLSALEAAAEVFLEHFFLEGWFFLNFSQDHQEEDGGDHQAALVDMEAATIAARGLSEL